MILNTYLLMLEKLALFFQIIAQQIEQKYLVKSNWVIQFLTNSAVGMTKRIKSILHSLQ